MEKFKQLPIDDVGMSIITYGELLYGAYKSHQPKKTLLLLEELVSYIPPIPLSMDTALHYGEIRSFLSKKGSMIGNNDLWIAAHTLALKITLVTNNGKEFSRIPNLKLGNWVNPNI